jgi:ribosomal protein S27E
MYPIFQAIISTVTALTLKRTCPKCFKAQIVSADKKKEKVSCKFCGADISPRKN